MNRFIQYSILLILLFISIASYPAEHEFPCGSAKDIMLKNLKSGYAYFATAIENNGFVIQLYINTRDGEWRVVGIDHRMHACNILQGQQWTFLKIRSM